MLLLRRWCSMWVSPKDVTWHGMQCMLSKKKKTCISRLHHRFKHCYYLRIGTLTLCKNSSSRHSALSSELSKRESQIVFCLIVRVRMCAWGYEWRSTIIAVVADSEQQFCMLINAHAKVYACMMRAWFQARYIYFVYSLFNFKDGVNSKPKNKLRKFGSSFHSQFQS